MILSLCMYSAQHNQGLIFKSNVANYCELKNVTKLCILIEELYYEIDIATQELYLCWIFFFEILTMQTVLCWLGTWKRK